MVVQQGFSIFSSTIGPVFFVVVLTVRTLIRVGRIIGETSSKFPAQVVSPYLVKGDNEKIQLISFGIYANTS
ncbi:hypothetical protein MHB48_16185 [Psychrobacillus sp. FSL H8-0483]|uniref:hypothetical protein n=1 Tax=Psychrobacillus sp. FSL H8-0483 TaxID=2921389 RepID=UPI0031599727